MSSRLAIFALLELAAHPDRSLSVADIAGKFGVSTHHLAKVMNALGRAGLVRAVRGMGGGYQFSGSLRRVTLLDVVEVFEDLSGDDGEAAGPGGSSRQAQALREVFGEIDDLARATLGSMTIGTMLKLIEAQSTGRRRTSRKSGA